MTHEHTYIFCTNSCWVIMFLKLLPTLILHGMKDPFLRNISDNVCLHSNNIGSSQKIGKVKKRNNGLPGELRECQIIRRFELCSMLHVRNLMRNYTFVAKLNNRLIMLTVANTSHKGNCTNNKLWWLSGRSAKASSVTTICDLTRASMSILTASNW